MNYFLYRLDPPRATFLADMTPAEGKLMQAHGAYWREQMDKGFAIALGPVADPKGAYGIAILRAADRSFATALVANDPVITAGAGFGFEIHSMPQIAVATKPTADTEG